MTELAKKIQALLFVAGEPMTIDRLSKILKTDKEEIENGLGSLEEDLAAGALCLVKKESSYMLVTAPEVSSAVEDFMKEELGEELTRSTLETLAVIVYKGPLSRTQIDYIRGVNSNFTVRNLMIRGLVERKQDPKDSRSWLYSPSFDFLKHVGIENLEKLSGYNEFKKEMDELLARENKKEEE